MNDGGGEEKIIVILTEDDKDFLGNKVATFPIAQRGLRPCKPGLWNLR